MTLKSLIQRLLDSRTTPAQAAHNASSIYTEPTWFNGTPTVGDSWTDNLYTGTAPSDGYLNVSGSANINTANAGAMIQAKISGAQISQVTPMAGQGFNMMAPISKGATFSVNGIRLADITVRFFKSIGGGYNLFVWRALSCLRPSFNFSLKSFCKANPNGLHPKAFQKGGCSCHLRLLNMSLLTMDTLAFTKTLQTQGNLLIFMPLTQLIPSLQGFAWALLKDLLHTQKLFLLEKVARLLSLMMQIRSKNYGFRRLSAVINNLGVGGALC